MPYTEKQRKLFHAVEENPDVARERGMSHADAARMAGEADRLKREGRERKPVGKADLPEGVLDLSPIFGPPPA